MSHWTEDDADVNGITIHYCRTGGHRADGSDLPLVILAHGFSDNALCFQRAIERLQSEFDVVAFDARNHGLSSRAAASSEAMVHDLHQLVLHLNQNRMGKKTYLIGHSMGASTVASVVAAAPDLVNKAVVDDPVWTRAGEITKTPEQRESDIEKQAEGFKRYLAKLNAMDDEALLAFAKNEYPDWHEDDLPAWVDSKRQLDPEAIAGLEMTGWRDVALSIKTPTLVIHSEGKKDGLVTPELAAELCAANGALKAVEIANAGHNIRRENFEAYIQAVQGFLID